MSSLDYLARGLRRRVGAGLRLGWMRCCFLAWNSSTSLSPPFVKLHLKVAPWTQRTSHPSILPRILHLPIHRHKPSVLSYNCNWGGSATHRVPRIAPETWASPRTPNPGIIIHLHHQLLTIVKRTSKAPWDTQSLALMKPSGQNKLDSQGHPSPSSSCWEETLVLFQCVRALQEDQRLLFLEIYTYRGVFPIIT